LRQCIRKPAGNLGGNLREQPREPPPSTAQIGSRKDDAGGDDADADFAGAGHSECEGRAV